MKLILSLFIALFSYSVFAEEAPPYEVKDVATSENLRVIYHVVDQHQHTGSDGSSKITALSITSATATSVDVSTGSTALYKMEFRGVVATLPTSGYPAFTFIITADTKKLYISTEAVVRAESWVEK